jgi:hypothetical protein
MKLLYLSLPRLKDQDFRLRWAEAQEVIALNVQENSKRIIKTGTEKLGLPALLLCLLIVGYSGFFRMIGRRSWNITSN